jgi:hypothetical protein
VKEPGVQFWLSDLFQMLEILKLLRVWEKELKKLEGD